ncbi:DUF7544 domain-containing protein [Halorussus ruber]|uniref:DUF7544 domain-containing protein n=1 Tax=Halorussus ruber TaxID=1126238 RepID=UPI0010930CD2|nr:hypothetical protein [Halorussus ruber]
MSWYAVDSLDDALDATRAFLTPVDARQWLKLALVVFFLGNAGGGSPSAAGGSSTGPGTPNGGPPGPTGPMGFETDVPAELGEFLPVLLGVVVVALVVGLLYALVGSVMEFVFVESLRRQRVRIRDYASQHSGRAVQLFAFRVALGLLVVIPALVVVAGVLSIAGVGPTLPVGLILVLAPLLALVGITVAVVDAFTVNFVVPVMISKNIGVIAGWKRFWPTLTGEWKQYGVYALVRFLLSIAVGIVASIIGSVVGAVLVAPLVVVGIFAVPVLGGPAGLLANPIAVAVTVLLALSYFALLTAALSVAFVPVQTYLRYHSLLVLGDTDRDFDLIPELRRDIRGMA